MVSFFGLRVGGKKRKAEFRKGQPCIPTEHMPVAKDRLLAASVEMEITGCFRPRDANPPRPSTARAMKSNSIFERDTTKVVSSAASMQNLTKSPRLVDKPLPMITPSEADLTPSEAVDGCSETEPWDSPTLPTVQPQVVRFSTIPKVPDDDVDDDDVGGGQANGALVIGDDVESVLDAVMATVAQQETEDSERLQEKTLLEKEGPSLQIKPLHRAALSDALPPPGPPPQGSLPSCPVGKPSPRPRPAYRDSPCPSGVEPAKVQPVILKVKRTKRDTFALCSPRRYSLSMKMEELERRLDEVEFHPVSDDSPDTTRAPSVSSVSDYGDHEKGCEPRSVSPPSPLHITPLKSKPLPPVPVEETEDDEMQRPPPIPERSASRALLHGSDTAGGASSPSGSEDGVASNGNSVSFPFRPTRWAAPTPPSRLVINTPDPDGGATTTARVLSAHDKASTLPLTPDSANWPLGSPVSPLTTPTASNAGGNLGAAQLFPTRQQYHWPRPAHQDPSLAPPALQRAHVPPPLQFGFFSRSPSGGARGGGLWVAPTDSMPSHEAGPGPDLGCAVAGLGIHMEDSRQLSVSPTKTDSDGSVTPIKTATAAEAKVRAMGPTVWMTGRDVREHSLVLKRRPDQGLLLSPTGFADNFGTQFI